MVKGRRKGKYKKGRNSHCQNRVGCHAFKHKGETDSAKKDLALIEGLVLLVPTTTISPVTPIHLFFLPSPQSASSEMWINEADAATRLTLSQFRSTKVRRATLRNYIKFAIF